MRALFTTILLLAAFSQLLSQDYIPMLEEGRYWTVAEYDGSTICTYISAEKHSFEGDTLIEGLTYGKFSVQNISSDGPMFCGPYSVDSQSQEAVIYLHEDPIAQRVFMYNSLDSSQFLLYDFNLSVGDTLHTSMFGDVLEAELVNISFQTFEDGIEREVFEFQGWFGQAFYYEGIGGEKGLFTPFYEGIGFGSSLWCHGDENQIIHSPGSCPDIVDGLEEIVQNGMSLYPTLTHKWVNLEFTENRNLKDLKIEVLDIQGKLVLEQLNYHVFESGVRLNLNKLVDGIYHIVVRIEDEQFTGRIIKTN